MLASTQEVFYSAILNKQNATSFGPQLRSVVQRIQVN